MDKSTGKKKSYVKAIKAKIMRDSSRVKAGTKDIAQSRGYGFVEFQHHGHALACLRQLNNNPDYFEYSMSHSNQDPSKRARLIVEFSLEDTRKVNMLKKRLEKGSDRAKTAVEPEKHSRNSNGVKNRKIENNTSGNRSIKGEDETLSPKHEVVEEKESTVSLGTKVGNKRKNREAMKKNKEKKKKKKV